MRERPIYEAWRVVMALKLAGGWSRTGCAPCTLAKHHTRRFIPIKFLGKPFAPWGSLTDLVCRAAPRPIR